MKPVTPLDAHTIQAREALINRYVDDRLDVEERDQANQWLADNHDERAQVREWVADSEALRRHYAPLEHAAVPERLLKVARRAANQSPMRYAAAIAWLSVGLIAGYFSAWLGNGVPTGPVPTAALWRDAALAHAVYVPEMRHAVEVGADQEQHLVTWLSKRVGTPLRAPRLQEAGFNLVGGRLLPGSDGTPVAQFMYQNDHGQRLTLYVRRANADTRQTAFRFAREGKVSVFYWVDGALGFALSGEIEREALLPLTQTVYQQLNP